MKLLIAGDFCQRYRVDKVIKKKQYGVLFDEIKSIIKQADYSVVNFEFPIVLETSSPRPILKNGSNLCGTIEAVEAIKYAGFNCCTLANNHILDQGYKCCIDTKRELEKAGIDTVGVGSSYQQASDILYKQIQGETLAIINCCEHEFSIATKVTAGACPLNPLQQYYKIQEAKVVADYVIVIVHGGSELFQLPSLRMKETYRFFIDAGADAVVNHHQHVFSGYECYKDKYIIYGLGNFLFDNPSEKNKLWNIGYIVSFDFHKGVKPDLNIVPIRQCQDELGVFQLKGSDASSFLDQLKTVNDIIINEELLELKYNSWAESHSKWYKIIFQPYFGRIAISLFLRGLLPSFINNNKKQLIRNFINCESHLDRLRFIINNNK